MGLWLHAPLVFCPRSDHIDIPFPYQLILNLLLKGLLQWACSFIWLLFCRATKETPLQVSSFTFHCHFHEVKSQSKLAIFAHTIFASQKVLIRQKLVGGRFHSRDPNLPQNSTNWPEERTEPRYFRRAWSSEKDDRWQSEKHSTAFANFDAHSIKRRFKSNTMGQNERLQRFSKRSLWYQTNSSILWVDIFSVDFSYCVPQCHP